MDRRCVCGPGYRGPLLLLKARRDRREVAARALEPKATDSPLTQLHHVLQRGIRLQIVVIGMSTRQQRQGGHQRQHAHAFAHFGRLQRSGAASAGDPRQ